MRDSPIREQLEGLRIDRDSAARRGPARRLLPLAVLAALLLVAAGVWLGLGRESVAVVRTVEVAEHATSAAATVLNASGYVTARRRATVSSKITGKLVEVRVEEGMPVREGEVLARLDDANARAALDLAESRLAAARSAVEETRARLELARLTLERMQRLAAEAVVGQADLDAAETERKVLAARLALGEQDRVVAEREVALRRSELDDTVVRAPFTGVVVSKDAQPGETVSPMSGGSGFTRTGICTVVDMQSLEIEVDVNEAYISRVRQEQAVEAVLDAYPDWSIPARVITTIPTADRQKATVQVRIGFIELDPRVLPDMGVKVAFRETREAGGAAGAVRFVVPRAALRRDGDRDVVFVVRGERVERRAVSAVPDGDGVLVTAGLGGGERVVVEGPADLADGQRVELR